jgi:hypothetical protein
VRIAVSSSSFRRPLAAGDLTQLEWVEQCARVLGADGVVAALADFPRLDADYTAQLRKMAVDLGIVPFGIDAGGFFAADPEPGVDVALTVAAGFGAAVLRSPLPAPGDVPPASFVETVTRAKAAAKVAKAVNVTLIVPAVAGTLGEDDAAVQHLLKDVDSAWLRAAPRALGDLNAHSAKQRFPTLLATPGDDSAAVAAAARGWLILDAPADDRPWETLGAAVAALRDAEAEARQRDRSGRLGPG